MAATDRDMRLAGRMTRREQFVLLLLLARHDERAHLVGASCLRCEVDAALACPGASS